VIEKIKCSDVRGSNYICSDIHGHFSLLETQLEKVNFDPSMDRLFSLGDLIDRSDESAMFMDWLEKPWFFAIQGNHERMLINAVRGQSDHFRRQWFSWGGDWAEDLDDELLLKYCETLEKLPIAIELEFADMRRVGLVHASLPKEADWNHIKAHLAALPANQIDSDRLANEMLWGRLISDFDSVDKNAIPTVANIDHVYHGHTIVSHYTTIGNRTYMDLGSYSTGLIGLINPVNHLDLL
jgi:serine/threonine protein phosphatase 1